MSLVNPTRLRWAVPAVVATAVAVTVAVSSSSASAAPQDLSPRTADELLTDLASSTTTALSGTVQETSALGLPELPASATGALGPMTLATGTHTLQVATDGPDKTRVALLGQLAEYDVVRSGSDVWTYTAEGNTATHYVLPARPAHAAPTLPAGLPSTPAEAAAAVLAAVGPTTEVGVDDAVTVAGRAARQLVVTPRDTSSLVGSVKIAVDAVTSVPLRVQVFAAGAATPALEVGFTDVSFTTPDAATFAFTPPAGAAVTTTPVTVPVHADRPATTGGPTRPTVLGTGWTSIVELSGVDVAALTTSQPQLLDQLTTKVAGGRLLSTALVSVLLTNDGRLLVGAVTPEALQAAA